MPTLRLTVFWCEGADTGSLFTPKIFAANRAFAKKYGFDLEILPQFVRSSPFVLPFSGQVIPESLAKSKDQNLLNRTANKNVRGLCHTAFKADGRIPIVLGELGDEKNGWAGFTVTSAKKSSATGQTIQIDSEWLPWCIIDPVKAQDFGFVVIHELIHAAGFVGDGGEDHSWDLDNVMFFDTKKTNPSPIMTDYAKSLLSKSYFCW